MPSSTDLNTERTFLSQWMSNDSRAGVILNPTFTKLENKPSGSLHFTGSLRENFPHDTHQLDDGNVYVGTLEEDKNDFAAMHEKMVPIEDLHAGWEHNSPAFTPDEDSILSGFVPSDPLLRKLEQLKELQQQKQEQLKRQQMEQLQRLMEEHKKLLTMVSAQQTLPGVSLSSEHFKILPGPSFSTTTVSQSTSCQPSHCYQNPLQDSVQIDRRCSGLPLSDVLLGPLQITGESGCSLPAGSRLASDSSCEEQYLDSSINLGKDLEFKMDPKNEMFVKSDICEKEKCKQSCIEDSCNGNPIDNADASINCDGNNTKAGFLEERPIAPGIKEKKQSFEEFLEEQMRVEERRLKQKDQLQNIEKPCVLKPLVKRPFLKRGEGIARFSNPKSKSTSKEIQLAIQQNHSEDSVTHKTARYQSMRRKTIPLSKEPVSEQPPGIMKNPSQCGKTKKRPITDQNAALLRNQNMNKCSKSLNEEIDIKHSLQVSDFLQPDMNQKMEANKENIMQYAKQVAVGNRVTKDAQCFEKLKKNTVLMPRCSSAPLKNHDFSFELSFQKRCRSWEMEKEKENIELDEFLLLEDAAEDISFSSNSSFVQKLLSQDQQIIKGHRMSSTPVKVAQHHQQTLPPNKSRHDDQIVHEKTKDFDIIERKSEVGASVFPGVTLQTLTMPPRADNAALQGIAWETSDEDDKDGSSNESSDMEDCEATMVSKKEDDKQLEMGREDNPAHHDYEGPSINVSRQNKSRDLDLDLSDQDTYSSDESTVLESESKTNDSDLHSKIPPGNVIDVEFDDERTWADLEKDEVLFPIPDNNGTLPSVNFTGEGQKSIQDKAIKRKVASIKKGEDLSEIDSGTSPTSDLMVKLFPSLKPKPIPDALQKLESRLNAKQEPVAGDTVRSQLLKEKLAELEREVEKFKFENALLSKLRADQEKAMEKFRREYAEFEQRKANELAQIDELKKEEMKKLQKERKVFEKYATAARAIPDKKERDEIQALKQQLSDLQEEMKRRESKWSTTHGRLRNQIETVTKENAELREEIKVMEKFRLEVWKKAEATEGIKRGDSGIILKKADFVSPANVLKNHIPSSADTSQKNTKITCRVPSPTKGKSSGKLNLMTSVGTMDTRKNDLCAGASQAPPLTAGYKGCVEEIQGEVRYPDGKVEKILKNGCHIILFPNGTRKEASADGTSVTVTFFNGDIKRVMPDQTVIYYFADAQTTHTTYPDGLEVLHFSNGQIEKHYPDGRKEITFPDQTVKNLFLDGREESIFPDGTIIRMNLDGSKIIEFNNGQREVHTTSYKRREYPDGTVKTVYSNGHQETKYTSGRVRVKDREGNVIMDTK
ncbi:centromere protein J isoform X2 [Pleurodeles waltl]|uniref:centromere protein J isoform X2 n=1 Tax=Pleurodeles waltl TaxID=8319 RepID=UPI0037094B30